MLPPPQSVENNRHAAEVLVQEGLAAELAGRQETAFECYRRAIAADPGYAPAHLNFGIMLQSVGELGPSIEAFHAAIAADAQGAAAHFNLAMSHLMQGEFEPSESAFRVAIALRPQFPEAWVGLAEVLEAVDRAEAARAALDTAIELRPDYFGALVNAGALARKQGCLSDAETCYRRALSLLPESAETHNDLGTVLMARGRLKEAEDSLLRAHALRPDLVEACVNLGSAAEAQGRTREAVAFYRQALGQRPENSELQSRLAWILHSTGRTAEAIQLLFDALEHEPAELRLRQMLAATLQGITLGGIGEKQRATLLNLCADERVSMSYLNGTIVGLIRNAPEFSALKQAVARRTGFCELPSGTARSFLLDPLLLAALPRMAIDEVDLEGVLALARRSILMEHGDGTAPAGFAPADWTAMLCALARQCFNSGYAFHAAADEVARAASIQLEIARGIPGVRDNPRLMEPSLSVAAMYAPLHVISGSDCLLELPDAVWSEAFRPLLQEQLLNRRREEQIRAGLSAITPIEDAVSISVREQYEESPYPVWSSVQRAERGSFEALSRRLRPQQDYAGHPHPLPVLIAGCGTGHHAIQVALAHPESEVLAVDLSLASLAYASRMAERHGVGNVTFRQADILLLGTLARQFWLIESGGVLHHLKDPMLGWKVLVDLLDDGGLMKIALYSRTARRGVQAAREFIDALKLPPTPDGVRESRRAVIALADGHPARDVLSFGDFYTLHGCRDLIMHVQERAFTLPQIAESLNALKLRFLGFESDARTRSAFLESFPRSGADLDLHAWNQFEQSHPDTFKGMYTFWCCKR